MIYLGNYVKNSIINYIWETVDASGNSLNPTNSGVAVVYQGGGTTQSTAGISYIVGFDGLDGVHNIQVDTTDVFYSTANDYTVLISGMALDSRVINTPLFKFSLGNRYDTQIYNTLNTVSGDILRTENTLITVSGNLNEKPDISTIVSSGNAASWNSTTDITTLTNTLNTVSGDISTIDNVLDTVSGNINNPITVSGITPYALSEIVTSGNAANWASDTINVTVSGFTPVALGQIVASGNAANWAADTINVTVSGFTTGAIGNMASGILSTTIDGVTASGILELLLAMVNGKFSYAAGTLTIYKRDNVTVLTQVSLPDDSNRTRIL